MLNFSASMHRLIQEIAPRIGELRGVLPHKIQISSTYAKSSRKAGLLAYVVPLKFRDGCPVEIRTRGRNTYHWGMLPHFVDGVEVLYLIYFVMPRFYDLGLKEKLQTVIHELYHIHPLCNGDLRRFRGRSKLHGDHKTYDRRVGEMTEEFLSLPHNEATYAFLKNGFRATEREYGGILAPHIQEPRPRLLAVESMVPGLGKRFVLPQQRR